MNLVRDEKNFAFYHASASVARTEFPEITMDGSVVLLKDFDEKQVIFAKYGLPKKEFKAFLRLHEFPIVATCTDKVFDSVYQSHDGRVGIILLRPKDKPEFSAMEDEFRELAMMQRSKDYVFIMSDMTEDACKKFAEDNAITQDQMPILQIVLIKDGEVARYATKGALTTGKIKQFFADWKQGAAEKVFKSEDPPAENPGPVYKVVGKNFYQEVIQPDADVFVKFYAPWCGHCKHLAPVYKELAVKMASNKKIKFVEIDSTKNEIPGLSVHSYPTLKFFAAKNKRNPVPYEGDRTVEAMTKFIAESSSFPQDKISDL